MDLKLDRNFRGTNGKTTTCLLFPTRILSDLVNITGLQGTKRFLRRWYRRLEDKSLQPLLLVADYDSQYEESKRCRGLNSLVMEVSSSRNSSR